MKSPQHIAEQLARHWQRADWREQQLLGGASMWPLRLPIGLQDTASFRDAGGALKAHLEQWSAIHQRGPGTVEWQSRKYRDAAEAIDMPAHWLLSRPSDVIAAITQLHASEHAQIRANYLALGQLIRSADSVFHRLLIRRLALWQDTPIDQVVAAARIAMQLEPGCAEGKPLRALGLAGNDSKFFERHESLVKALLDERFDGEASRQGLAAFLGAINEDDHWLLVAPLADNLLPFRRLRVTASELQRTSLPAQNILLIENERCLHQLPQPLPDTIAILGAGLNLGWLSAPWLCDRHVGYWGDMDTWGLAMLATARSHLPQLSALLMNQSDFESYAHLAVTEQVHAGPLQATVLGPEEAAFDAFLRRQEKGRLEQEFLPASLVAEAVKAWLKH